MLQLHTFASRMVLKDVVRETQCRILSKQSLTYNTLALRKNRGSSAETPNIQISTVIPSTPSLTDAQMPFDQASIAGNEPSPASGPRTPARQANRLSQPRGSSPNNAAEAFNVETSDQLSSMLGNLSINPSPSNTGSTSRSASPFRGFGESTSQYGDELAPGFKTPNSTRVGRSYSAPEESDEENLGVPTPPRSVGRKSPNARASWQTSTPFLGKTRPLGELTPPFHKLPIGSGRMDHFYSITADVDHLGKSFEVR